MNTLMNKLNQKKSGKKGFTLMEMLIVVAIIAILVAIMIPTFTNALAKAKISADEANLRAYYADQISAYLLEEGTIPDEVNGKETVIVDGVEYKLQAGNYDIVKNEKGDSFTITYHPKNGTDVTIPGAKVTTPANPGTGE